jgi:hypothetical protein
MQSRAIRASAILYGLFAFAGVIVVRAHIGDRGAWTGFLLEVGPTILAIALFGSIVWLTRPNGQLAITLRRGTFLVHGSPREAIVTIGLMFIAALTLGGGIFGTGPIDELSDLSDGLSINWPTMILVFAVACAFAVIDTPTLRISPAGIAVHGLRRHQLIAWGDIGPAGAVVDRQLRPRRLTLLLRADPDTVRWRDSIDISVLRLNADGRVLASVINYYVAHPDAVAQIGSPQEFARLTTGPSLPSGAPAVMGAPA